jgi:hypothetical protein
VSQSIALATVWCIQCGATPTVAVTVERRGVLMHYGSCWAHVAQVAERARRDTAEIDRIDRYEAEAGQITSYARDPPELD